MEIIAISDTHNDHEKLTLPSADILIHAGDACIKGNYTEVKDFLQWLVKQPFKYKVYVPGNHDKKIYKRPELQDLAKEYGIHVLFDDLITIEGIKIYGNASTFKSEERLEFDSEEWAKKEVAWDNIPEGVDILVTHIPPKGILDQAGRNKIGCTYLKDKVLEVKPKLHLFGHCHETRGLTFGNKHTTFKNVGCKDYLYETVDLEGTKIEL